MNDERINNLTDAGQNTESEPSSATGQTSSLRLKTSTADTTHKTQGISSSSYSITASYQSAVREQQNSLYKQRKTRRTLGIVKKTITLVIILTVILFITIFAVNHIHLDKIKPKETKSTQETLCESKWTANDIGSFIFTEDNKVTRKKGTTETGTYEITNENVLIMHFKKEDLSYLIETDSDGTVKWVHSYNGFEEVIIPNTIPITK